MIISIILFVLSLTVVRQFISNHKLRSERDKIREELELLLWDMENKHEGK